MQCNADGTGLVEGILENQCWKGMRSVYEVHNNGCYTH